ncbi:MAG: DUF4349 domain-containing protein [Ginsengibacter sp.]
MKKIYLLFTLTFLFAACDRPSGKHMELTSKDLTLEEIPPPKSQQLIEEDKAKKAPAFDTSVSAQSSPGSASKEDWDKKIIKTAYLKLEVTNFKTYADVIHKAAKQYGGYIANEEQNQTEDKIETTIAIKVPVEQFDAIMNDLPSTASKIIEKKITSDDVTGEVVDTKSRLEAKRQMRLKYLEFLKQSKNMAEVLQVQNEINNIQEQIESASGRINYLSHQSSFSTINLIYYQPLPGYVPTDKTPGFAYRIIEAFKTGLGFMTEIFIGIISIWPIFLILIGVVIIYKKRNARLMPSKQKL